MWCPRIVAGVMVYRARELCPVPQVQLVAQERKPDLDECGLCVQSWVSPWPFHASCTGHRVIVVVSVVA